MTVETWCEDVEMVLATKGEWLSGSDQELAKAIEIIRRQQLALKRMDDACEGTNETIVNALVDCDRIAGGEPEELENPMWDDHDVDWK